VARRLAAATGTDGLVVDRGDVERLLDRRYELELAAADARAALAGPEEAAEALAWLLEHVDRLLAAHLRAAGAEDGPT
jgi:hypothetical protein